MQYLAVEGGASPCALAPDILTALPKREVTSTGTKNVVVKFWLSIDIYDFIGKKARQRPIYLAGTHYIKAEHALIMHCFES